MRVWASRGSGGRTRVGRCSSDWCLCQLFRCQINKLLTVGRQAAGRAEGLRGCEAGGVTEMQISLSEKRRRSASPGGSTSTQANAWAPTEAAIQIVVRVQLAVGNFGNFVLAKLQISCTCFVPQLKTRRVCTNLAKINSCLNMCCPPTPQFPYTSVCV